MLRLAVFLGPLEDGFEDQLLWAERDAESDPRITAKGQHPCGLIGRYIALKGL